ncbi:odorant receptor 2a-like isoform X2 [Harpegnathos saltator]|uniref:odorant receptor 2a-like isoform X2 n=1 Tax=Harpegnathos saltator TaxID=610380 RepID=UPI000DBECFEB|nr:odorant receptor 2a-like isoform X2 [Harpegnathos saltator]
MDNIWNHYYGVAYKLSLVCGMWPHLERRTRIFRISVLTAIMVTIVIPQLAFQYRCKGDIQCTLTSTLGYLLSLVILVKVYTFQLNIHELKILTEHLYVDWKMVENSEEQEIMKSYANHTRLYSLIYSVYCVIGLYILMCVCLVPFILDVILPLNESRPMLSPHPAYYFVDEKKYFIYIFIHALLGWKIVLVGVISHDCMFVSYVQHICSMFAVTGYRFKYLFYECNEMIKDTSDDFNEKYHARFTYLVQTHRETLRLAQLLENTFTKPFGLQIVIATIGLSITLQQITVESNLLTVFRYILYVIGQLIHLFCLNFQGQKLLDNSIQICDKIYNSPWYKLPIKMRKLLMLVMMKTYRPTFFSAAKLYVFSLENFAMSDS